MVIYKKIRLKVKINKYYDSVKLSRMQDSYFDYDKY